jgi:hypothetical protein
MQPAERRLPAIAADKPISLAQSLKRARGHVFLT